MWSFEGVCEFSSAGEAEEAVRIQNAAVGQQVLLACDTYSSQAVNWWFISETNVAKTPVFLRGVMVGEYAGRTSIDTAMHNIIIGSIELKDAGTYTCVEDGGQGKKYNVRLKVYSK